MKMKRVFSSLMALGLASTLVACGGGENKDDKTDNKDADTKTEDKTEGEAAEGTEGEDQSAEDFESQTSDDTLVVGLGELNGDFLGGWTNNAGDVKVRRYMGIEGNNGYKTVVQDEGGEWVNNKAVLAEDPKSEDNEDGSKTVTFKLKDGLKWSDGEPVTADDYLFASLLHTHPEYSKLTGSTNIGHDSAKGYEAYKKGDSDVFEGLEKVDDLTFKVTIDASFLPYYEEAALLAQDPLPMHALSENLAVSKEGDKLVAKDGYTPTEEDKKAYVEGLDKQIEKQKADFEENYPAPEADASEEDKAEYEEAKKKMMQQLQILKLVKKAMLTQLNS